MLLVCGKVSCGGIHIDWVVSGQEGVDLDVKLANIRRVVHKIPDTHFPLLKRLIEHLDKYVSRDR